METDIDKVRSILEKRKRTTAEEMALDLGFYLTQGTRNAILRSVRSALRKVVDTYGGKRDEINNERQQIYELQ